MPTYLVFRGRGEKRGDPCNRKELLEVSVLESMEEKTFDSHFLFLEFDFPPEESRQDAFRANGPPSGNATIFGVAFSFDFVGVSLFSVNFSASAAGLRVGEYC